MCGIAGHVDLGRGTAASGLAATAELMASRLAHRGPDDHGVWVDENVGLGFGHRRLAVIDLTEQGHQPMVSPDERFVLVLNGEIYNHQQLRAELGASRQQLRGTSDTEVFLHTVMEIGVETALRRVDAMLAVAVYDRRERRLHLAVDRFGEKPLYWGIHDNTLLFGSEISALLAHPRCGRTVDRDVVASYLRHGCVPGARSILAGVSRVEPGTMVVFELDGDGPGPGTRMPVPSITRYWSAVDEARSALANRTRVSRADAVEHVRDALEASVRLRMVADVPVGAFLSGGIDSSLVVAMMQRIASEPVRTFTIGFDDPTFDESADARAVASHLNTAHTELIVTPDQARAAIPRLAEAYSEPFADASQLPTLLVSDLARRDVTVALTGDGGDELFGGYNRHVFLERQWPRLRRVPAGMRSVLGRAGTLLPRGAGLAGPLARILPDGMQRDPVSKLRKLSRVVDARSAREVYDRLTTSSRAAPLVIGADPRSTESPMWDRAQLHGISEGEHAILADTIGYLPDDILVKLDRAAMSVSLETRTPFLAPQVFSAAWELPTGQRVGRQHGKVVLRELLADHLPRELFERPKTGFAIPLGDWLRGPLQPWADELLSPTQIKANEMLDPVLVGNTWAEHRSGIDEHTDALWSMLVLQQWLEHTGLR